MRFDHILLLHGKGGSPNGSVRQLQAELEQLGIASNFERRLMPHSDPNVLAEDSLASLAAQPLAPNTLIVGISLGGLIAAKLQELRVARDQPAPPVIAISAPTWADGVALSSPIKTSPPCRIALYGTHDDVIAGRTSDWPALAEAYAFSWLTHDTDAHKRRLAQLVHAYIAGDLSAAAAQLQAAAS
jgi:hypothetical protein